MKRLFKLLFLYLPLSLLLVIAITAGVIWQQRLMSESDLRFLTQVARTQGPAAVYAVIKTEITGEADGGTDPSYGRVQQPGRGHAPWVIRGNLDGRARVLSFALAPGVWAAYDTASASLYQVWRGDLLFQGSVYDYRHGPQPLSSGEWYFREDEPAGWYLQLPGEEAPVAATVRYLGHEYQQGQQVAGLRYELAAGDARLEVLEIPELVAAEPPVLLRRFSASPGDSGIRAIYGEGSAALAVPGEHRMELRNATPLPEPPPRMLGAGSDGIEAGKAVIENSDCLGCHSETQRVAGPSWGQVAGRYLSRINREVLDSLVSSIRDGSQGTWGASAMPPHPELSEDQARAAAIYILSRPQQLEIVDPPLDGDGEPYPYSWDYDAESALTGVHPAFDLENLLPAGFEPKVGGMDLLPDGRLVLVSWDADGAVFLLDLDKPPAQRVRRIAEGLHEPLGLAVVDGRIFVLQKQELTELIDRDGDDVIDVYRAHSYDWSTTTNFHSFAFGLVHDEAAFYLLLSVCVLPGGAACPEQMPSQGKLLQVDRQDGNARVFASGFRTPNGINWGRDGTLLVTDNQGDWLPASKLIRVQEGAYYGLPGVGDEGKTPAPPVAWLPQDEIGNSPTQPLLLIEGPYAGQSIHGDVYTGGIKRVFMEEVEGQWQGAAFPFSAGFQGPVNRLLRDPDGAIYVGEIGNPPNWGLYGKPWFGLERLRYNGSSVFELLEVRAQPDGFTLVLSEPLDPATRLEPGQLLVRQWFYHPNEQYGGPKFNYGDVAVANLALSGDGRQIRARIPGLKPGYVAYLRLDPALRSQAGQSLWVNEAWYTLNRVPVAERAQAVGQGEWIELFDGETLDGWRNYRAAGAEVENWVVEDGTLALRPASWPLWPTIRSYLFGGASGDLIYPGQAFGDFELELEWKIAENGNSGIFYLVAGEEHNTPWLTGLEMQVLHNEGHADGRIEKHRAGDLYDLVAAAPETVRPPGQWNQVRIVVKGDLIEHWLNGVKVVSIQRGSEEWQRVLAESKFADMPGYGMAEQGYIVLQDHGDPVWYRNIRIRELKSAGAP